jgi:hypothetical protein
MVHSGRAKPQSAVGPVAAGGSAGALTPDALLRRILEHLGTEPSRDHPSGTMAVHGERESLVRSRRDIQGDVRCGCDGVGETSGKRLLLGARPRRHPLAGARRASGPNSLLEPTRRPATGGRLAGEPLPRAVVV